MLLKVNNYQLNSLIHPLVQNRQRDTFVLFSGLKTGIEYDGRCALDETGVLAIQSEH